PLPLKAVASDADPVSHRAVIALDEVEVAIGGIDDDGARRFTGSVKEHLPPKRGGQLLLAGDRHDPWLIFDLQHADRLRFGMLDHGRKGHDKTNRYQKHAKEDASKHHLPALTTTSSRAMLAGTDS